MGGCIELMSELRHKPLSSLVASSLDDEMSAAASSSSRLDLARLLRTLAQSSCSLIVDSRLARTIQRIDLVHRLCSSHSDELVRALAARLIQLQREKERDYMEHDMGASWLCKEVANLARINQYATLRRACASYIEGRLAPLFAFLLAQIDAYANLDTLSEAYKSKCDWKVQLWLRILQDESLCKISYADMR